MKAVVHNLEIAACYHFLLRQLTVYPFQRLLACDVVARHYALYAQSTGAVTQTTKSKGTRLSKPLSKRMALSSHSMSEDM